ncbi:MAG: alternative ribosome rescue aminoacyl-tRNA hydrolase ArfB [Thermodesulfobacteriota bacterium]
MIRINESITIPDEELSWDFVRASGPGGQNVNKTATAAKLYFDAGNSRSLPPDVAVRLLRLAGRLATSEGIIVIDARRFASQSQNREDAESRLAALVRKAVPRPKPRIRTRPTRASRVRRMDEKRIHAGKKRLRGRVLPGQD